MAHGTGAAAGILLVLMSSLTVAGRASEMRPLSAWCYDDANAARGTWSPSDTSPAADVAADGALLLRADFANGSERVYWDAAVTWDLGAYGRFSLDSRVEGAAAVGHVTIYFRSGGGWYGASFAAHDGSRTVPLRKTDFTVEGSPDGWAKIDGVRLAIWAARRGPSSAARTGLGALQASGTERGFKPDRLRLQLQRLFFASVGAVSAKVTNTSFL